MRELARDADIHIVSLTEEGEQPGHYSLAAGLTETTVPKTRRHFLMEREASAWAGAPVGDIMSAELVAQSPEYLLKLGHAIRHADAVVLTHPYLCSAVRELDPNIPLAYDAAN
ncbi:MAG: hypothetical protein LC749_22345, partial [Actinobacteria bacterium]|nr:hypothetical protein [Actinomycetota bacterium]